MSHIFDSKLHQSEFYVYENYVVYLHVYHVRFCSPTPTYKQPLYGCHPDEPQASLATTNRCNHVYVILFFILLFMYAVIHCLYSVGNQITTTTNCSYKILLLISQILVEVMAWCCWATNHYLSQCWPKSMSPESIHWPVRVREVNIVHIFERLKPCWVYLSRISTHT